MFRLLLSILCLWTLLGCESAPSTSDLPASRDEVSLRDPAATTWGDQLATCTERRLAFAWATKNQEYGAPWTEQDTFVFYDEPNNALHIAMLGTASNSKAALERIEDRRGPFDLAIAQCEARFGLPKGEARQWVTVSYTQVLRKTGKLKPVVRIEGREVRVLNPKEPIDRWEWLGSLR